MVDLVVQRDYAFPAAQVWALLEDFGNISWAPGMDNVTTEGEGVGMVRIITLEGAATVHERLEAMDAEEMSFEYSVPTGGALPVTDYRAGPTITALDDKRCHIDWRCTAKAEGVSDEQASEIISGFLTLLLQWIDDHLSAR